MPILLAALRLAQDEVSWWAAHLDAVPEELPKRIRDEMHEQAAAAFSTHTVQALLRYMVSLRNFVAAQAPRMAEEVGTRLEDERRIALDVKLQAAAAGVAAAPAHVRVLLRELPAHLAIARSGGTLTLTLTLP